jgi:hypothetical protein
MILYNSWFLHVTVRASGSDQFVQMNVSTAIGTADFRIAAPRAWRRWHVVEGHGSKDSFRCGRNTFGDSLGGLYRMPYWIGNKFGGWFERATYKVRGRERGQRQQNYSE